MIEYLKDAIEMDPGEAFPTQTLEDGVQFTRTGDEVVDAWEKDIAKGAAPDFSKAFKNEADRKVFEAWLKPKKSGGSTPPAAAAAMPIVEPVAPEPPKTPDQLLDEELPDWLTEAMGDGFSDDYNKEQ